MTFTANLAVFFAVRQQFQKTVVSPSPGLPDLLDPGGEEGPVLGPEAPGLRGRDLYRADTEEGAGGG